MFPATEPADVEALTNCIDYVLERSAGRVMRASLQASPDGERRSA
jgi:hypothetical protein